MEIFNKYFFIALFLYFALMCAIDIIASNEISWIVNSIIAIMGAFWFGYLKMRK